MAEDQDRLFRAATILALRDRLVECAWSPAKSRRLTANDWSPITVGRMAPAVARGRTPRSKPPRTTPPSSIRRRCARWCCSCSCWSRRSCCPVGAMLAVGRRVIKPLHNIRDAMLKVAARRSCRRYRLYRAPGRDRRAGGRAGNLQAAGRGQAAGSRRRSASATRAPRRASARSRTMSASSKAQVRETPAAAGRGLQRRCARTSSGLTAVSRQTNERVQVAEKASGEASMSVESVASASEELSASINDISQQAAHAAGIAEPRRQRRRARPTAPCRGSPNRRAGSARWSA